LEKSDVMCEKNPDPLWVGPRGLKGSLSGGWAFIQAWAIGGGVRLVGGFNVPNFPISESLQHPNQPIMQICQGLRGDDMYGDRFPWGLLPTTEIRLQGEWARRSAPTGPPPQINVRIPKGENHAEWKHGWGIERGTNGFGQLNILGLVVGNTGGGSPPTQPSSG